MLERRNGEGLLRLTRFLRHSIFKGVLDVGTYSKAPVDYPDYAEAVATALREYRAERGIILCGSGVGASMAANRIPGIRVGLCHDTYSAHQGVEHDDMNVLVLGGRVVGIELVRELIHAFVKNKVDLTSTIFIVSSKSGSTLEPNIFKQYFFDRVSQLVGPKEAGQRFLAITDPGSKLQQFAESDGFRHVFFGWASIGGRYSALSDFGLVRGYYWC